MEYSANCCMCHLSNSILCAAGWWFGTFLIFPYIGNYNPIWRIFFKMVKTTNRHGLIKIMSQRLWKRTNIDVNSPGTLSWKAEKSPLWNSRTVGPLRFFPFGVIRCNSEAKACGNMYVYIYICIEYAYVYMYIWYHADVQKLHTKVMNTWRKNCRKHWGGYSVWLVESSIPNPTWC